MAAGTGVTPAAFGAAMAGHVAGVAVVTAAAGPRPMGLLVTSLTAYSADPPSLVASIATASRTHDVLVGGERFGVHLLGCGQHFVAEAFASRDDDKFDGLAWRWDDGIPRLDGVCAYFACSTAATFGHGDHSIVIGRIDAIARSEARAPLIYWRRRVDWELVAQ
jgi:flavin reductase ActVB